MSNVKFDQEGVVFDIQRYSIHDGPGIRTIVFLKGCPLSCLWCCNPESQVMKPVVMFQKKSCVECGRCIKACAIGAISFSNPTFVDREKCVSCGKCVDVCISGALTMKGRTQTVWETMQTVQKDATNYRRSRGGLTLSGGEPLMQPDFCIELLKASKERGWTTAIETTGFASEEVIDRVMPLVDYALVDIKHINSNIHKQQTGVPNERILENSRRIASITSAVVRIPTIPGFNADPATFEAIGRHALTMNGVKTVHLLPYHTFGENKYHMLGQPYPMEGVPDLTVEKQTELKAVIEGLGLQCVIGG